MLIFISDKKMNKIGGVISDIKTCATVITGMCILHISNAIFYVIRILLLFQTM